MLLQRKSSLQSWFVERKYNANNGETKKPLKNCYYQQLLVWGWSELLINQYIYMHIACILSVYE